MLFNSYPFIFVFLPATLLGFFLLASISRHCAAAGLAGASLLFYAWWDWRLTFLLLGSVLANHMLGRLLARSPRWLPAGVAGNLVLLGYFKYLGFFTGWVSTVLPIGISFYSFTQIAYLVDVARQRARPAGFVHYLLFVTYFPHLIAGPVLHHGEMIPQFRRRATYAPWDDAIGMGLAVFLIGLFKKTMLADSMGAFADIGFAPAHVASAGALTAWAAAVAYTLQIYFDFSAYCDMAIGISQMFNIRLPANFNSPYKACSVIDFWRRWHMTLSRFLRDYLYIPLGGNRHGAWRRHANLLATMLFGGLWHGAGWTFIVWGGLHGVYLVINHLWRAWGRISLPAPVGWLLTFLPVVLAWTVFRAPDLHSAGAMLWGMAGGRGMGQGVGLRQVTLIALLLAIALALPNLQQMMRGDSSGRLPNWLGWRPGTAWALACFGAFAVSLMQMTRVSPFLYFQF